MTRITHTACARRVHSVDTTGARRVHAWPPGEGRKEVKEGTEGEGEKKVKVKVKSPLAVIIFVADRNARGARDGDDAR